MSIVFDRAVEYYDQTRALPPEVAQLPIDALIRETGLHPGARVLEVGIGTGRIALPLAAQIGSLTGVDLSMQMMALLQAKASGRFSRIDLARADAVQLPFPRDFFDVILAVHVLHLVNGWRDALNEARRALKRHGYFVASWHRRLPDSPNVLLRQELERLVNEYGVNTRRPGAQSEEEILEELENWHGEVRVVNVSDWTEPCTPAQILEELDRQIHSVTWMIPRPVLDEALPRLREWAVNKFESLDRQIETPYNFRWLIARKP